MNNKNKSVLGMRFPLAVAAIILTAIAWGCSDTGCLDNRSSIPFAGFYSYQTGQKITLDSVEIGGIGAPNDSLLMTARNRYSTLYLPFRFEYDNTSFFIRYVSEALNYPQYTDTIRFDYNSRPMFMSEECGAMYEYEITKLTYTRHLIDSIAITDSLITNTDTERIEIYFRTSEPDEEGDDV